MRLLYLNTWTRHMGEILTPNYHPSSLYLPLASNVHHSLYDNEGQADEELHFPGIILLSVHLFFTLPASLYLSLSLCSGVRPGTLRLRGPGGRGALLFRGSCDSSVEPRHSDRRRLLGGGAQRSRRRLPLRAGRRFH